ncbi:MAG TPA: Uma2 family endonuclease [Blastocatellia bacterium]|nr:Uma2 family endonuclease [Blastocatellia bacterium]
MAAPLDNLPRHYYTLEEYFALEHASDARYEYWDGDILCMSGGSQRYYTIGEGFLLRLARLMEGQNGRAFSGAVPIQTPSLPPYRYPDGSVVCGKPTFTRISGIDALTNPVIVIEVLSPGTERLDKEAKRHAYQKLASLKEYLIVAQDAPHIIQYRRQGRRWVRQDYGDLKATLELTSINRQVLLADIYAGITFD